MATDEIHDLELLLRSRVPLVVIETHEERRVVSMLQRIAIPLAKPVFQWSVTDGLRRVEFDAPPQRTTAPATEVLKHIKACDAAGVYLLADMHPYLDDPVNVRLIKEIALAYDRVPHTLVMVSHQLTVPPEIRSYTARFDLPLPDRAMLAQIVEEEATRYSSEHRSGRVRTDRGTFEQLITYLAGLNAGDARRLARAAIYDDGSITPADLPRIRETKYRLMDRTGALSLEYDTGSLADVGGLRSLKRWLKRRRGLLTAEPRKKDRPKGILLVGVQGGGKSLAAKAVAGLWELPLLRLDIATLYNKYFGESERNLREAIKAAEAMAPCVLWVDEIEKALASGDNDGGTSRRMLGTLLTWMAENGRPVFIVATANEIEHLPPELIRKGRLDEIFFVDLPGETVRRDIFAIHLKKRALEPDDFDLDRLAASSEGFSGAEIEQTIVSGLYLAREQIKPLGTEHLLTEIAQTRPLAVVMAERVAHLRHWAQGRTVPADAPPAKKRLSPAD